MSIENKTAKKLYEQFVIALNQNQVRILYLMLCTFYISKFHVQGLSHGSS